MLKIEHEVNTIFIMLGAACNLSCRYCMQHDLIECLPDKQELNTGIIDFIEQQALSYPGRTIDIRFYGGEPLLYLDNIKQIVKELNDKKIDVEYSIISNGKLLNMDTVEFLNDNNFHVAISWDGRHVNKTRFYDVLKAKKEEVLSINNLNFIGVTSAYNYPMDMLEPISQLLPEYYEKHHSFFTVWRDEVVDHSGEKPDLTNIDFDKVRDQNKQIIEIALTALSREDNIAISPLERLCIHELFSKIERQIGISQTLSRDARCFCGNAVKTINIDLKGNLYQCHNNWKQIGNINSDSYESYMDAAHINENISRENYETKCKDCSVSPVCLAGCPLIDLENRAKTNYCLLKKANFEPYIEAARELQTSPDKFNKLFM